jgi:hypothetical protein
MTKQFINQEQAFENWIERHSEEGYLLNCIKGPAGTVGYVCKLHRASCTCFTHSNPRTGKNFTTRNYYKVCSTDMDELVSWGKKQFRVTAPKCKLCL